MTGHSEIGRNVRIAIVDDELFFREAIRDILVGAGFDCAQAENGREGLVLARDLSIGVMMLDMRMPDVDGLEVMRQLRDERPDLRIVVLSGSADQETVLEALRLGACDYLVKPLHDEELVLAVRRATESYAVAADGARLRTGLLRLVALADELDRLAGSTAGLERDAHLEQAAAGAVAELLGARKTSLMLLNEAGDELRVVAAVGRELCCEEMDPVPVGDGVAGVVLERSEAVLVEAGASDPRFGSATESGRYQSDSFAVAPVTAAGRSFGVLCATDPRSGEGFRAEDLVLLRLLARLVAGRMAVGREAKGPVAERDREPVEAPSGLGRESDLVREICTALVEHVEPDRVIRGVLEPIAHTLSAVPVSLYLMDGANGRLAREGQVDGGSREDRAHLPFTSGLTGTVMQSGHLVATDSPADDARFDPAVDTPADGVAGPFLCVPLRMRGKVVGLCRVFLPAGETACPRIGEALSAALSAAIRNVLLYRSLVESIEEVAEARREARS